MGYRITLLATPLAAADPVLHGLRLKAGDQSDSWNETQASGASDGERYIIWVNDDSLHFAYPTLLEASKRGELLVLLVNETVMVSGIMRLENGKALWSVAHVSDEGADHLVSEGNPPDFYQEVVDGLRADSKVIRSYEIDYAFEVPIALFKRLTGFRHDEEHDLSFVALEQE